MEKHKEDSHHIFPTSLPINLLNTKRLTLIQWLKRYNDTKEETFVRSSHTISKSTS